MRSDFDVDDVFEQAKTYLPKYLTPQNIKELYSELSRFPDITSFYLSKDDIQEDLLQGDGWRGFVAINFNTGERKTVSGIIISNSCDISAENARSVPVNILFAPLVSVSKYADIVRSSGKPHDQIEAMLQGIRKQRATSIFFLPSYSDVLEESLILLDDIHAHPLNDFINKERSFLMRLNQTFFYIFLIKLSIHFSRFQEGILRFPAATGKTVSKDLSGEI